MVGRTVLQKSVLLYCRKDLELKYRNYRLKCFNVRNVACNLLINFFCNTAILLHCNTAQAKSLGTHGVVYPIEEQDPIQLIQQKLQIMGKSGELAQRNTELQKKTRASVERPKPVEGITKATKARVFYFDPTYVVKDDLKDHQGNVFAKKGARLSPLETISLSHNLIFFDGDDDEQLAWVKDQIAKASETNSSKLILVRGAPPQLAEELGIPVYFDQNGMLTKKLGIKHVPALVNQENLHLKIEEMVLPPSQEPKKGGIYDQLLSF